MNQFLRVAGFAKPFWKILLVVIIFIIILAGLSQVEPFIARTIVDSVVSSFQTKNLTIPSQVVQLFVLLIFIRFLRVGVRRVINFYTNLFAYRFRFSLSEKGFSHLMSLSTSYFDQAVSGELMSKLDRGTSQLTQIVNNSGLFFIPSLITAILSIAVVSYFYWPIAIWILLLFIPFTWINLWRFRKNQKLEKEEYKLYDNQYGHFWEALSSIRLIKSFIAENFEIKRLKGFNQKIYTLRKQAEVNWNISSVADLMLEAWIWSIYVWVVFLGFKAKFSVGTMILLLNYLDLIRQPLWELNWFFWEAKRAQIGARDYFKILDVTPSLNDPENPVKVDCIKGRITFEKVHFSYKDQAVLEDINLTIEPGSTVAFVGPSGSGKTTIVSLISRFYDVDKGKILIDGVDLRKFRQRDLRNNIGWVTQDPYLFAASIAENLYYGNPKAGQKELEQAATISHAHLFIQNLPHGYQTKIGEKGVQLSGGQKQRVALARVILKNPPILVLDEATSSLDSASEMLIQQALEKITKGRTTIIIAHRLSTARKANQIFVLDRGKLIERGNHQELLNKGGLYSSLFKIQAGKIDRLKEWDLVE